MDIQLMSPQEILWYVNHRRPAEFGTTCWRIGLFWKVGMEAYDGDDIIQKISASTNMKKKFIARDQVITDVRGVDSG